MTHLIRGGSAVAACLALGTAVYAAVLFDPMTGVGFVGKGDVQYTLGWNNAQLQQNAAELAFRAKSATVTEVSWICTNSNNENIQERARTTSTTTEGVVASAARVNRQVTGFNLNGYEGEPTTTTETDGPQLNSCPSGPWTLTTPAGDPVLVEISDVVLEVSVDGDEWVELLEAP